MRCRFRECANEAVAGWTTCRRHHSAGVSKVQHDRMQRERERRAEALQRQADARAVRGIRDAAEQIRRLREG